MRRRWIFPSLLLAALAPAAQAQLTEDTGFPSETQNRIESGIGDDFPWDLLGLLGLVGLLGLRREHPEDSYHPTPVE